MTGILAAVVLAALLCAAFKATRATAAALLVLLLLLLMYRSPLLFTALAFLLGVAILLFVLYHLYQRRFRAIRMLPR